MKMKKTRIYILAVFCVALLFQSGCMSIIRSEWTAPEDPEIPIYPEQEAIWSEFVQFYYPSWTKHYWVDKELWGNQGYIYRKDLSHSDLDNEDLQTEIIEDEMVQVEETIPMIEKPIMDDFELDKIELETLTPQSVGVINKIYVIQDKDTLWDIAGKKEVYGDPLKWPLIYNANRDVIDNPDLIYPDQQLIIPQQ